MDSSRETLIRQGYAARRENRPAEASGHFAQAIELCRAAGDAVLLAQALTGLGQIERDLGNLSAALKPYEEAVAIYRGLDLPLKLAHSIRHLADILRNDNQFNIAAPHYEEALSIYRSHEETPVLDLANTIRGYALLKAGIGSCDESRQLWEETRILYLQVGVQAGIDEADRQIFSLTRA